MKRKKYVRDGIGEIGVDAEHDGFGQLALEDDGHVALPLEHLRRLVPHLEPESEISFGQLLGFGPEVAKPDELAVRVEDHPELRLEGVLVKDLAQNRCTRSYLGPLGESEVVREDLQR